MSSDLVPRRRSRLAKRKASVQAALARMANRVLLKFRYGYVFENGEWRLAKVKMKPRRFRATFEDGTPAWDFDNAAPLPFDENMRRLIVETPAEPQSGSNGKNGKQRKRRYIPASLGVEGFFRKLNEAGTSYAVLRWFEDLPGIAPGEDIDLLFADEAMPFLEDLLIPHRRPGAIKCDVYSASGLPGSNFEGLPYYEQRLARDILANTRLVNGLVNAPDTERHFLSLAYHAVYHKAHNSGLPLEAGGPPLKETADHDYAAVLSGLAARLGWDADTSLRGLHAFLASRDWAPATDTMRKLSVSRPVLRVLTGRSQRMEGDRELSVFIVREWARDRGILPWITANLRHFGFDVKIVHELTDVERANAAARIRGGNWNRGPFPVSGGEPYAVIAACDYAPEPPDAMLRQQQPFARNARSVAMKLMIRNAINQVLPPGLRTNAVHGSDDDTEAWEYLEIACPDLVETVRQRVAEGYRGDPVIKLRLHRGKRATSYLVFRDGKPCVLKLFSDHPQARIAYNAEKLAMERFARMAWAPEWIDAGPNWILERFYPQANRLDRVAASASPEERMRFAVMATRAMQAIHAAGFAHRDIHAENFFLADDRLVLIDYETLCEQPSALPFRDSYDVTGKGLKSPFTTGSMCYTNSRNDRSLVNVLEVPFDEALAELEREQQAVVHQLARTGTRAM